MKIKINKEQATLIERFRSKDRSRYALNNVGVIGGYLYATDGRRCVRIKMKSPVPDGCYHYFRESDSAYLFNEESLFPAAEKVMPDFNKLIKVCEVKPIKREGILMMNCIIDIYEKTKRRIQLGYLTDLDIGKRYSVFVNKGEEVDPSKNLFLVCDYEDNLFYNPEIVLLPFRY